MKILLIRHATVDKNSPAGDTLTERGTEYSSRLVRILKSKDLIPDVVFYDNSGKGGKQEIERCHNTVASLSPQKGFKFFKFHEACKVMKDCLKYRVAAVCYTTESLKHLPKIMNSDITKYTGGVDAGRPPKDTTDALYRNILVIDAMEGKYSETERISTGDYR